MKPILTFSGVVKCTSLSTSYHY